jgi:hypothetical protein
MLRIESHNPRTALGLSRLRGLASISGNYLAGGYRVVYGVAIPVGDNTQPSVVSTETHPNLVISGSSLTLNDGDGKVAMTGTITPHGTIANVFDVSLTAAVTNPLTAIPIGATLGLATFQITPSNSYSIPAGTIFKGILFQTSSDSQKSYIKIVTTAKDSAVFFMGSKHD